MDVPLLPIAPADFQREQYLHKAQFFLCDIWGADSGAAEDSSSVSWHVTIYRHFEEKTLLRNDVSIKQLTRCNLSEDLNLQFSGLLGKIAESYC
jgi:hypothetical protein